MKLKIRKEDIIDGLQRVQSIVNPRTTLPILSNVLFRAENDRLWLSATDLEVSVRASVPAEVLEEGGVTLHARRAFSIFRELSTPEIEISADDRDLAEIRSGSSRFKMVGISEDDFPPLPSLEEGNSYTMEQGALRAMLQKTAYAASTDETRQILNGVLLSFRNDKLTAVATDGRRLALVEHEVEFPPDAESDLIVPSKTIGELIRTLGEEGTIRILATNKQVVFDFGDMLVVSRLIEGTYPNYRQVIPASSEQRVPVERESLLAAVRRAALMTTDQTRSVRLNFFKNQLEIVTETPDIGEARETIPIKYTENDISVAFNPEFLLDPLKTLDSDEIFMEITDELSPGVIKSDVPFLYVLMPMRIS
jgi:DNA polymerase III subunit beta